MKKEIKIQELEKRLELGSWLGGESSSSDGNTGSCGGNGSGIGIDSSDGNSGGAPPPTTSPQPTTTIESTK